MFKLDNINWRTLKPHFFDRAWFAAMFKVDNILCASWNPKFFDKACLVKFFKLDNMIGGVWKSHFLLKQSYIFLWYNNFDARWSKFFGDLQGWTMYFGVHILLRRKAPFMFAYLCDKSRHSRYCGTHTAQVKVTK